MKSAGNGNVSIMFTSIYTWLMCQAVRGGDVNACLSLEFENHVL